MSSATARSSRSRPTTLVLLDVPANPTDEQRALYEQLRDLDEGAAS